MGRLIQADRRATLTEITPHYNRGMQQSICEATSHQGRWATTAEDPTGYHSSRLQIEKKRLQFARAHQNWTVED